MLTLSVMLGGLFIACSVHIRGHFTVAVYDCITLRKLD